MTLRVGQIPDLETEPFYVDMMRRGVVLYEMPAHRLAEALEQGEIDAAPVPLMDCLRLADRLQPVAGFCVASMQRSGSVFLYTNAPLEDLAGARVGLIEDAFTASKLLDVLLHQKYKSAPVTYASIEAPPHDALLLVGKPALLRRGGVRGFEHTYDLGAEWFTWTGLPFVFARWMIRPDVEPRDKALLQDTLYVALDDGVDRLYRLPEPREDLLMLQRDVMRYIRNYRYFIGLSEEKAMEQFRAYVEQLPVPSIP
ncbi:MAG: menaquinone biosynthetic enzyme MqnA/MqnD family protein [Candidatus Tectimicrobiota bacterium]